MGISVADNFSYLGGKPLDGRIQYATLAAMKAMADATLYEGCEAYCIETDKYYQWKSSNTVDASTGKWRERTGGGGGSGVSLGDVTNASATVVDKSLGEVHITWNDPNDVPGETGGYLAQWKQTILVKKVGSAPTSPSDGTVICTNMIKNQYSADAGYVTDTVSTDPTVFTYYRFFPVSTQDVTTYGTIKTINLSALVYGFKITQSESNPDTRVTYLEDAVGMNPAYMDFSNNTFEYGSWSNSFFMQGLTPVMLYSDGTEAYELNPNDLTEKADGTASDVGNTSFDGNAMMRVPRVYIKATEDSNGDISIYFSEDKIDSDYHCWAHHDDQGHEIPYLYLSMFHAYLQDGKYRSLTGLTASGADHSLSNMITYARANYNNKPIWCSTTFSSWMLIQLLSILITKSTDLRGKFGNGICSGRGSNDSTSGVYADKGLFYGLNGNNPPVKIFGIENWYGEREKKLVGGFYDSSNKQLKFKLTYGQEDGTTVTDYNTTGADYLTLQRSANVGSQGNIKTMKLSDKGVIFPDEIGDSGYYATTTNLNSSGVLYAGGYNNGTQTDTCPFNYEPYSEGTGYWNGTMIECRPRLGEESIIP